VAEKYKNYPSLGALVNSQHRELAQRLQCYG